MGGEDTKWDEKIKRRWEQNAGCRTLGENAGSNTLGEGRWEKSGEVPLPLPLSFPPSLPLSLSRFHVKSIGNS